MLYHVIICLIAYIFFIINMHSIKALYKKVYIKKKEKVEI